MTVTEEKMEKIRRLEKLHGVKVGERIKLRIQSTLRDEEVDSNGVHEIRGKGYQVDERFVVIKTSFGTHPSYIWSDFEKWKVE